MKEVKKKTIQELYLCVCLLAHGGTFRGLHTCLDRWLVAEWLSLPVESGVCVYVCVYFTFNRHVGHMKGLECC